MKSLWKHVCLTATALAVLLAPVAKAQAQEIKPVAVVAFATIDKLLGDIDYLAKTGGAADAGRALAFMATPFMAGLDRTKPGGAYVTMDGETPVTVVFIATKDLTMVLRLAEGQRRRTQRCRRWRDASRRTPHGGLRQAIGRLMPSSPESRAPRRPAEGATGPTRRPGKDLFDRRSVDMKNLPASLKAQALQALEEGAARRTPTTSMILPRRNSSPSCKPTRLSNSSR